MHSFTIDELNWQNKVEMHVYILLCELFHSNIGQALSVIQQNVFCVNMKLLFGAVLLLLARDTDIVI